MRFQVCLSGWPNKLTKGTRQAVSTDFLYFIS
nr:MAG TPA: hypothetical protein [Caudoviricetes sp.]